MRYISLRGDELESIDFVPSLIIGFYQSDKVDIFIDEYKSLIDRFPEADIVGCSAESVIENNLPYVDLYHKNSTVYMCMDMKQDAYYINIVSEGDFIAYENDIEQDILILSAYSSRDLEDKIKSLSEVSSVHTISGGVAGLYNSYDISLVTLFVDGKLYSNSLLSISIDRRYYRLSTKSIHLFEPAGLPMRITKTDGNTIIELDGVPALEMIESLVGKMSDTLVDKFGYPLFLGDKKDCDWSSKALASIIAIDKKLKTIELYRQISEGEYVEVGIMVSKDEQLNRLQSIYDTLKPNIPSLLFLCIGIPANLGIMEYQYLFHIKKNIKITYSGFHTFGEIGRAYKSNSEYILHNQTMTFTFILETDDNNAIK